MKYLYFLAEGPANIGSVRGETEDDATEKYEKEHGNSPDRVLGVTKDNGKGILDCHVVWENADEEN
jgi:hypothetical protein